MLDRGLIRCRHFGIALLSLLSFCPINRLFSVPPATPGQCPVLPRPSVQPGLCRAARWKEKKRENSGFINEHLCTERFSLCFVYLELSLVNGSCCWSVYEEPILLISFIKLLLMILSSASYWQKVIHIIYFVCSFCVSTYQDIQPKGK